MKNEIETIIKHMLMKYYINHNGLCHDEAADFLNNELEISYFQIGQGISISTTNEYGQAIFYFDGRSLTAVSFAEEF